MIKHDKTLILDIFCSVFSCQEREQQDADFAQFQAKAERRGDNADAVMSNYWRADEDLDEDERFLRDYVMNRQWLETDSLLLGYQSLRTVLDHLSWTLLIPTHPIAPLRALVAWCLRQPTSKKDVLDDIDDDQDDEDLEDADEFEKDYNFRFEVEEGRHGKGLQKCLDVEDSYGCPSFHVLLFFWRTSSLEATLAAFLTFHSLARQIQGHARFPENSVRERNDKRKRQRKEKAERKEADKIRRTEELKRFLPDF